MVHSLSLSLFLVSTVCETTENVTMLSLFMSYASNNILGFNKETNVSTDNIAYSRQLSMTANIIMLFVGC